MAVERAAGGTSLIDVLDRVLDKGIVIDAWVRVSLVGIDLITVEARVVVASIDTYLKYSEGGQSSRVASARNAVATEVVAGTPRAAELAASKTAREFGRPRRCRAPRSRGRPRRLPPRPNPSCKGAPPVAPGHGAIPTQSSHCEFLMPSIDGRNRAPRGRWMVAHAPVTEAAVLSPGLSANVLAQSCDSSGGGHQDVARTRDDGTTDHQSQQSVPV